MLNERNVSAWLAQISPVWSRLVLVACLLYCGAVRAIDSRRRVEPMTC